jgi:purine catabolism regulator
VVLGELVEQEDLGLALLSGEDALGREIAGAHSIDVEDPTRFLERGWVMLTTGMRLKGNATAQRELIGELEAGGIAALGIGIDLVFKKVPPALLEEAKERSYPVFTVPLQTPFRDIVGFINRSLLSSDLHTYQRLTAIQRHLVDGLHEAEPRKVIVERLAKMLDAGVAVVTDGRVEIAAGTVPDGIHERVEEREYDEDGWHIVTVPAGPSWLAVASRRRSRVARSAAQAAVPLLAATERLDELARDQERAVRSALLDEALDSCGDAVAARAASFGLTFDTPARVAVIDGDLGELPIPHLITRRDERTVVLMQCPPTDVRPLLKDARGGVGRPIDSMAGVPLSFRDAELALERVAYEPGARLLEYEDFDVCTLLLSEVPADHIRAKVDALLAPIRANPGLYEALVEYFARDMDVTATAEAMHVHPNTLRYRLARIEKLLGRSLRQPATIAELTLALLAAPRQM